VGHREDVIAQRSSQNTTNLITNGRRLSRNRKTWVVAKDPERGYVLIGGLGAMGVGEMWFPTAPRDEEDPTYADAPVLDSRGQFGGPDHDDESFHQAKLVEIGNLIGELGKEINDLTLVRLGERPCLREAQQMLSSLGKLDGLRIDAVHKFYERWPADPVSKG